MANSDETVAERGSSTADLERVSGYRFHDDFLLRKALTHSSMRTQEGCSYERLEFLGDAVVGAVLAELLFRECTDQDEGVLTKMKSAVVCRPTLAAAARRLDLGQHAIMDKSMLARGLPDSLLSDLYEAFVGAVYLDGGMEEARSFILRSLETEIADVVKGEIAANAKSLLQLQAHRKMGVDPAYRIVEETGPAHRRKFRAAVKVADAEYISGWAGNKAMAEREAAAVALKALGLESERETVRNAKEARGQPYKLRRAGMRARTLQWLGALFLRWSRS
jgi:ribonuclease III